jgi:hypothetical protein
MPELVVGQLRETLDPSHVERLDVTALGLDVSRPQCSGQLRGLNYIAGAHCHRGRVIDRYQPQLRKLVHSITIRQSGTLNPAPPDEPNDVVSAAGAEQVGRKSGGKG